MANVVELFKKSPTAYKVSLVLVFPVLLIFIIGFCTQSWIDLPTVNLGLWRQCFESRRFERRRFTGCRSLVDIVHMPGKFILAQLFECLGLIALFTTLLCLAAQLLVPKLNKVVLIFGILAPLASGICILVGVGLFVSVFRAEGLSYSFYLTILAGCGCIVLFILGIINKIQSPPQGMSTGPAVCNVKAQGYVISPPPQSSEIQPIAEQQQQQQQQPQYLVEKDASQFQ